MNRFPLITSLILFCVTISAAQQNEVTVKYYVSTEHFMSDRLSSDEVILELRQSGSDFLFAKSILDPKTKKKSEDADKPWAISNNGDTYINLRFSNSAKVSNLFIKVDIKGRFCLAVMDPAFAPVLEKADNNSQMSIGGMNHSFDATVGGNYFDEQGVEKLIFIVDTKDLSMVIPYKAKNAPAELLSVSTLKWLVGKEKYTGKKKDYTVEDIIAIVEDLNRRQ